MRALALTTYNRIQEKEIENKWHTRPAYHIRYPSTARLGNGRFDLNQLDNINIDTLLFSGGHGGGFSGVNELSPAFVREIHQKLLSQNKGKLQNIAIDSCESAEFIPLFKDLLAEDGIMYANLSDGVTQHIYTFLEENFYKNLSLNEAYNLALLQMDRNFHTMGLDEKYYPAIYSKKDNTLYYLGTAEQSIIRKIKNEGITVTQCYDIGDLVRHIPMKEEAKAETLAPLQIVDIEPVQIQPKIQPPVMQPVQQPPVQQPQVIKPQPVVQKPQQVQPQPVQQPVHQPVEQKPQPVQQQQEVKLQPVQQPVVQQQQEAKYANRSLPEILGSILSGEIVGEEDVHDAVFEGLEKTRNINKNEVNKILNLAMKNKPNPNYDAKQKIEEETNKFFKARAGKK